MSAFTKPPNEQGSGGGKPDAAAKPGAAKPAPASPPAVLVSRTIEVGPAPARKGSTGTQAVVRPPVTGAPPERPAAQTVKMESAPKGPPKSVRPSAPPIAPDSGSSSIADTFERLLSSDVDEGFAAIAREVDTTAGTTVELGLANADLSEVRALFAQLAANHVRPVRDFVIELRWGEATSQWVDVCEPALRSLRRAAEKLELEELCAALDAFTLALATARGDGKAPIAGDRRAGLLAAHTRLADTMPQAFALDLDRSQREAVILQSLFSQVPDVKKVTIDKLYAAGLTTIEAMLLANPGDIAATTGIDEALAKKIVDRFNVYRNQVSQVVPDATHAQERDKLASLTARLRREHDGYERASQGWTKQDAEQKKELRASRERTVLEIQVVLARLGEVDRLKELDRLPFERKVAHLEAFLAEAHQKYVAQP